MLEKKINNTKGWVASLLLAITASTQWPTDIIKLVHSADSFSSSLSVLFGRWDVHVQVGWGQVIGLFIGLNMGVYKKVQFFKLTHLDVNIASHWTWSQTKISSVYCKNNKVGFSVVFSSFLLSVFLIRLYISQFFFIGLTFYMKSSGLLNRTSERQICPICPNTRCHVLAEKNTIDYFCIVWVWG